MNIYTVSVFHGLAENFMPDYVSGCGWYSTWDQADYAVRHNINDIYEFSYPYAVIERVGEGLFHATGHLWFYEYDREAKRYRRVYTPSEHPVFKHAMSLVGWSL